MYLVQGKLCNQTEKDYGSVSCPSDRLLFILVWSAWIFWPVVSNADGWQVYDLTVARWPTAGMRVYKGVMLVVGGGCRVCIYWCGPNHRIGQTDPFAFSDLVLVDGRLFYWYRTGGHQIHSIALPLEADPAAKLPADATPQSVMSLVLQVAAWAFANKTTEANAPSLIRFFTQSKGKDCYELVNEGVRVCDTAQSTMDLVSVGGLEVLDKLGFARRYRKSVQADGTIVWQMSAADTGKDLARLVLRPAMDLANPDPCHALDPGVLGRWSAVPACYRQYWALIDQVEVIRKDKEPPQGTQDLLQQISTYLQGSLPDELRLAALDLWLTVAIKSGRSDLARSAAMDYFQAYLNTSGRSVDLVVMELVAIGQRLSAIWPQDQIEEFTRPLLEPLIDPKVFSDRRFVHDLIIFRTKVQGAWLGMLVLDYMRERGCQGSDVIALWRRDLMAAAERPRGVALLEPNEITDSISRFLQAIEGPPAIGQLSIGQLEQMVAETVRGSTLAEEAETMPGRFASLVCQYIRWLVGEGPFNKSPERLSEAIKAFVNRYMPSRTVLDQKAATLASLLALSFYDTSTEDDHLMLIEQLTGIYNWLQMEVEGIMRRYQITDPCAEEDIKQAIILAKGRLAAIVEDPFFPMFKFPLFSAERQILDQRLLGLLEQIGSAAQKVASEKGLAKTSGVLRFELDRLIRQVLVEVIHLRASGVGMRITSSQDGVPLIFINLDGLGNANQTGKLMERMKGLYLGAGSLIVRTKGFAER